MGGVNRATASKTNEYRKCQLHFEFQEIEIMINFLSYRHVHLHHYINNPQCSTVTKYTLLLILSSSYSRMFL